MLSITLLSSADLDTYTVVCAVPLLEWLCYYFVILLRLSKRYKTETMLPSNVAVSAGQHRSRNSSKRQHHVHSNNFALRQSPDINLMASYKTQRLPRSADPSPQRTVQRIESLGEKHGGIAASQGFIVVLQHFLRSLGLCLEWQTFKQLFIVNPIVCR